MKKIALIVMMLASISLYAQNKKEGKGEINQRLENQQDRIQNGNRAGEETINENKTLRTEEKGLRNEVKAERQANGGKLNKQEKRQVNRQLNQESRQIKRDNTNKKERR